MVVDFSTIMRQYLSKLQKNSENFLLYFAQPQNILQRPSFFGISKQPKIIVELNALRDSVPFVQFKKREEHPWRSVTFACNFTKRNTPASVFFTFLSL